MTPRQREYAEAVEKYGSITAAARALGVHRKTIYGALERKQASEAKAVPASAPATAESLTRIASLEKMVEDLTQSLEKARQPRAPIIPGGHAPANRGDFLRMTIPDSHGCYADATAIAAVLSDMAALKPKHVIMTGDHLDCGGFLAEHHTLSYVPQAEYVYEDDVGACNDFLDAIQSAAPGAEIEYLEGNHERRVEQWCIKATLRSPQNAAYIRRHVGVEFVLNFEKRGIKFYRQGIKYDGCSIPATIKRGNCFFTHGTRTGMHAAAQTLSDFGANVVFGHTHRIAQASTQKVSTRLLCAWNPGCLCELVPLYGHGAVTGSGHGYGLQFVRDDGDFIHLNVPIIDGRSYLGPLLDCLKLAA